MVKGGAWRGKSVMNALVALPEGTDWVLVHDGARPMVTPALIRKIARARGRCDALTLAVPVTDTLFSSKREMANAVVERDGLWAVQTPQLCDYKKLLDYHRRAAKKKLEFSDDTQLFLHYGGKVKMVEGDRNNIKVTYREDLRLIEGLLDGKL